MSDSDHRRIRHSCRVKDIKNVYNYLSEEQKIIIQLVPSEEEMRQLIVSEAFEENHHSSSSSTSYLLLSDYKLLYHELTEDYNALQIKYMESQRQNDMTRSSEEQVNTTMSDDNDHYKGAMESDGEDADHCEAGMEFNGEDDVVLENVNSEEHVKSHSNIAKRIKECARRVKPGRALRSPYEALKKKRR